MDSSVTSAFQSPTTKQLDMSRRRLRDYHSADDDEYLVCMHDIVTAPPLGSDFSQPVQLVPHVYLGSQLHAESLRTLRTHKITHVLNCAGYSGPRLQPETSPYKGLDIEYLEFKAHDDDDYDIAQHFADAFKYLDRVQQRGGKALVHCAMGINRSVAVAIAYLMHYNKWNLLKATEFVKERRRLCLSNEGFRVQLVKYARARGLLDPMARRRLRTSREDEEELERAREFSRSLPRDPMISKVLSKGHFNRSDSLIDTGLMFRYDRFMNREKL